MFARAAGKLTLLCKFRLHIIQYSTTLLLNVKVIAQGMFHGVKHTHSDIHANHKTTKIFYNNNKYWGKKSLINT